MKKVVSLLALFLSYPAWAINAPTVPGQAIIGVNPRSTVAADSFLPPAMLQGAGGIFTIVAGDTSNSLTSTNYYPFYKNGVAYQVTAGKTAVCFDKTAESGVANAQFQLVSATASFAFNAASLTGGVYQASAAGKGGEIVACSASTWCGLPGSYQFAASTYPGIQSLVAQTLSMKMDCQEVTTAP